MIAWLAALLAILTALLAAPLVLASHAALQDAGRPLSLLWLGFLTMLGLAVLGAGALALVLSLI